jgi:rubrerythrin
MNENKSALEVLEFAIRCEIKAYNFYHYIANKIEEKDVRYLCRNLAGDEKIHRNVLEDRYMHLSEGKKCEIVEEVNLDNVSSVSSLGRNGLLEVAIKMEKNAQDYYYKQSKIIQDKKSVEILLDLYNTEKEHEERLTTLIESKG